jgi:diaminohydroxyphosphoribosylaminopyrimidine deaminase / 5-amino-6-(5-phosphoribosylamino)uracil reductase
MKHFQFMQKALNLSLKGKPSPNPYVGCVLVKNNKIIGQGYHKKCGEDHAEVAAIKDATAKSNDIKGSTMYVTLEPCSHHGKTPPCADSIIKQRISEIYISLKDPNPKVNGQGIEKLRNAGIRINVGLLAEESKKVNEVFLKHTKTKKPFVVLKAAISLDGKIATKSYDSKWITNRQSRQFARKERSKYDAILVGINTVLYDNPKLTGSSHNPLRIVLDSKLRIPLNAKVLADDNVMIVTTKSHDIEKLKELERLKIKCLVSGKERVDLNYLMNELGNKQITSILVEGGAKVLTSFLNEKIADKINLYISPKIIGNEGISFVGKTGCEKISKAYNLKDVSLKAFEDNMLIIGYLK